MQDSQRKIHTLRIISQDENTLAPDVNALQDAFNIASFPGLPPNGLLLIKKFDLGVFKSHSTSLAISRLIDNKIQALSNQAVCVDDEEYPEHDVVWFSDPAQAVTSFIKLIIKQNPPQAWYWFVLFPSWRTGMSLADVMLVLSNDFNQQETKPYVMAGVIQQLLSESRPDTVLAATTTQLAQHLLAEAGIYPHLITTSPDEQVQLRGKNFHMQSGWQALICKAIFNWGNEDVRTLWLAYSVLIKHNPALSNNRQLLTSVVDVIDQIQNDYFLSADNRLSKVAGDKNEKVINGGMSSTISGQLSAKQTYSGLNTNNKIFDKNDHSIENSQTIEMDLTFESIENKSLNNDQKSASEKEKKSSQNTGFDEAESITNEQSGSTSTGYSGFVLSEHCGLAFLISLLELLEIRKLLLLNPLLAELNFPARIIRVVAQRFCIADEHPVLQSLPESQQVKKKIIENFISPANWEPLIFLPQFKDNILYLFNIKAHDSACYITDRTKKLLLYVGKKEQQQFPSWMKNHEIKDQPGVYGPAKLTDLENTIQLLCSRYLYRYAQTGLRQLLNRKGYIAITKTHIDILFDNKQIDHRIRIAGLDINPGWVFWLARVVQFHYDSEVHTNA